MVYGQPLGYWSYSQMVGGSVGKPINTIHFEFAVPVSINLACPVETTTFIWHSKRKQPLHMGN